MALQPTRHLITVDEYYRMAEAGILSEDDRVELIEGEIIDMAAIGIPHAACVDRLNMLLNRLLPESVIVRVQNPIYLNQRSQPQPDLALLKPQDYSRRKYHPDPSDVLWVIEVSDTTLTFDRKVKVPLYARASIPELWIVNLQEDSIEVYTQPGGDAYRQHQQLQRGQSLSIPGFPDLTLAVDDILGR
ncbi:MAG TPA: Uma2 family endonuclease [Chloroflexia bacterium]|nr:Uma2 family endonuclease [Chloroflexia bacterium]